MLLRIARRPLAARRLLLCVSALPLICLGGGAAFAQRAGDNAVASAEDAFGSSVGNESIGLYTNNSARGFSPVDAGNVRIEGLYFDQKTGLGSQLARSSTLRVGLTAQAYPFPAPTGIVDYRLRLPGDKTVHSAVLGVGMYDQVTFDLISQVPLISSKLGMVAGASISHDAQREWVSDSITWAGTGLLHWTPSDAVEIIPFWSRTETRDQEVRPSMYSGGSYTVPKVRRRSYFSQEWADAETRDTNYGVLGTYVPASGWRIRAGLFRSLASVPENYVISFRDTLPDRTARQEIIADPPQYAGSYSGEVRVSRRIDEGPRAHTFHLAVRGRDARRVFGGGDTEDMGPAVVGVYTPVPRPAFVFGPQRKDIVKQGTAGLTYGINWARVGEFSAGIQKTRYTRSLFPLGGGARLTKSTSSPWLYNATVAVFPTSSLVVYGGYTRGLEASGIAPDNAVNRGEALPANITRQADAGIRYAFSPQLRMVAGVFDVSKPFLDRDAANLFGTVGRVRNKGIEASISGEPMPGLTLVAGAVLLSSRVTGFTVTQGTIGEVPPAIYPRVLSLAVQYGPPSWGGFSVDADIENQGDYFADRRNTYKITTSTLANVGARYRFLMAEDVPATLRLRVENLTDHYNFHVHAPAGGWMHPTARRRYSARLSVDF